MVTEPAAVTEFNTDGVVGSPTVVAVQLLDIGVATVIPAASVARAAGRRLASGARPLRSILFFPPLVPQPLQPGRSLARLADLGGRRRQEVQSELGAVLDRLVPALVDRVLRHVDLTRIVREHVDVESLVATIDLEAIVRRLDMATMATDIIATLDLPEIIRESTSAVSSETVRQVRMRGISADEAIGRAAYRFRPRRSRNGAPVPAGPATDGVPLVGPQVPRSETKDSPA
jgi:hypothetical protein